MGRKGAAAVLLLAGLGLVAAAAAPVASAAESIELSTASVTTGQAIVVKLAGWRAGVATVSTCGNDARRGSPDCDLLSAQSVKLEPGGTTLLDFTVTRPPVDCPCVVRASTVGDRKVVQAPVTIDGVPASQAPVVDAATVTQGLRVRTSVVTRSNSWPASWAGAFGGSADRALVVRVDNRRGTETSRVRVTAVVGRNHDSGQPLAAEELSVAAGQVGTVRLPFALPAPAFGEYVVYGEVAEGGASTAFSTSAENDPWAAQLMVPVALLVTAWIIRWRRRARPASSTDASTFQQSSPEVGEGAGERSTWSAYDPKRPPEPAAHPVPAGSAAVQEH